MSSPKPPPAPPLEEFDDGFKIVRKKYRGVTYVLKELSAEQYEQCLKGSTNDDDETDSETLTRLMFGHALQEPDLTVAQLYKLPHPVFQGLSNTLGDMHFSMAAQAEDEDDDEGKAKKG